MMLFLRKDNKDAVGFNIFEEHSTLVLDSGVRLINLPLVLSFIEFRICKALYRI